MISTSKVVLSLLLSAVQLWSAAVHADEAPSITLTASLRLSGFADRAFIVLSDAQHVLAVAPATYRESAPGPDGVVVGRLPIPALDIPLRMLFVVMGKNGEVWSSYREARFEEFSPSAALRTSDLRNRFVERRGVLRSLQAAVTSQEARLSDLEADADAIANVNKIVSAEDELGEVKASIARVAHAQARIQEQVMQMKARPLPLNAQKREVELSRQLGELSASLSATEANSLRKISSATSDLQQKLRMIDETRDEHIDLLEHELAEIRRRK